MSEPLFYLDMILPAADDESPPVLDWQGGQTEEPAPAPPAGPTGWQITWI